MCAVPYTHFRVSSGSSQSTSFSSFQNLTVYCTYYKNQPFSIASRQFLSPCNCMTSYSTLALKMFPIDIERRNIERHYIERHFSESQNLNYSFHCAIIWLSRPITVKQQTVQSCIKPSSGKDGKDIFVE